MGNLDGTVGNLEVNVKADQGMEDGYALTVTMVGVTAETSGGLKGGKHGTPTMDFACFWIFWCQH
jgi:hypothetical protein